MTERRLRVLDRTHKIIAFWQRYTHQVVYVIQMQKYAKRDDTTNHRYYNSRTHHLSVCVFSHPPSSPATHTQKKDVFPVFRHTKKMQNTGVGGTHRDDTNICRLWRNMCMLTARASIQSMGLRVLFLLCTVAWAVFEWRSLGNHKSRVMVHAQVVATAGIKDGGASQRAFVCEPALPPDVWNAGTPNTATFLNLSRGSERIAVLQINNSSTLACPPGAQVSPVLAPPVAALQPRVHRCVMHTAAEGGKWETTGSVHRFTTRPRHEGAVYRRSGAWEHTLGYSSVVQLNGGAEVWLFARATPFAPLRSETERCYVRMVAARSVDGGKTFAPVRAPHRFTYTDDEMRLVRGEETNAVACGGQHLLHSFGVAHDPTDPTAPFKAVMGQSRIHLARSSDGVSWELLCPPLFTLSKASFNYVDSAYAIMFDTVYGVWRVAMRSNLGSMLRCVQMFQSAPGGAAFVPTSSSWSARLLDVPLPFRGGACGVFETAYTTTLAALSPQSPQVLLSAVLRWRHPPGTFGSEPKAVDIAIALSSDGGMSWEGAPPMEEPWPEWTAEPENLRDGYAESFLTGSSRIQHLVPALRRTARTLPLPETLSPFTAGPMHFSRGFSGHDLYVQVIPVQGLVHHGGRTSMYTLEMPASPDWAVVRWSWPTTRLIGFRGQGTITTPRIHPSAGDGIYVNFDGGNNTRAQLRAELIGRAKYTKAFSLDASVPVKGDVQRHLLRWQTPTQLPNGISDPFAIRFHLEHADGTFYGFEVCAASLQGGKKT